MNILKSPSKIQMFVDSHAPGNWEYWHDMDIKYMEINCRTSIVVANVNRGQFYYGYVNIFQLNCCICISVGIKFAVRSINI